VYLGGRTVSGLISRLWCRLQCRLRCRIRSRFRRTDNRFICRYGYHDRRDHGINTKSTVGVLPILGATDDGGSSIGTVHRLGAAEL
jgi:hypothetical protein